MDLISEQRLARRAAILEAARQMIAERGYAAVTMRDRAQRGRVSVPTLYNQFGGKDQLLAAAIEEHFRFPARTTVRAADGLSRLMSIMDACADRLVSVPAYHQRLLEAFASLAATQDVQVRIARDLAAELEAALAQLQGRRQLAAWMGPDALAMQMTAACIGVSIRWSAGFIADRDLQANMRIAMGLPLLAVLRGAVRRTLEQHLQQAQRITGSLQATGDRRRLAGGGKAGDNTASRRTDKTINKAGAN